MFTKKIKYFLIIENIKDIDLKNIKKRNKFFIIYRNNNKIDKLNDLLNFRQKSKVKAIKFFVSNKICFSSKVNGEAIDKVFIVCSTLWFSRSFQLIW